MQLKTPKGGAKKVVITAPGGVTLKQLYLTLTMTFLTVLNSYSVGASCTHKLLGPMAKALHDNFGVVEAIDDLFLHSVTKCLDGPHQTFAARVGAANTFLTLNLKAAKAIDLVIPELNGKLTDLHNVPTPTDQLLNCAVLKERYC